MERWGKSINFTYVPVMQDMVAHMARDRDQALTQTVGRPIVQTMASLGSVTSVQLKTPGFPAVDVISLAVRFGSAADKNAAFAQYDNTRWAGIYELALAGPGGPAGTILHARNANPDEGDLAKADRGELAAAIGSEKFEYVDRTAPSAVSTPAEPVASIGDGCWPGCWCCWPRRCSWPSGSGTIRPTEATREKVVSPWQAVRRPRGPAVIAGRSKAT